MRIGTYNINGLQSALSKGLGQWIANTKCDILCLQELRHQNPGELTEFFAALGYNWFFEIGNRPGHAGVGILTPRETQFTQIKMPDRYAEGRVLGLQSSEISLFNIYAPSGGVDPVLVKIDWWTSFLNLLTIQSNVDLILGDYNITHLPIDSSGSIPDQHLFFNNTLAIVFQELKELGYTDAFRVINQEPHQYTWRGHFKKTTVHPVGRRIDYISIREDWEPKIKRCFILQEAQLSDHRPVIMDTVL